MPTLIKMPATDTRKMCSRNTAETSEIMDTSVASSPALSRRTRLPCSSIRIEESPSKLAGVLDGGSTDPALSLTKRGIPVLATYTCDATQNVEPSEELQGIKDGITDSSQQPLDLQRTSLKPYKSTCVDNSRSLPRKKRTEMAMDLLLEWKLAEKEVEAAKAKLQAAILASESEDQEDEFCERTQEMEDWLIQPSEEIDVRFKRNMKSNILELAPAMKNYEKDDMKSGDPKMRQNMNATTRRPSEQKKIVKCNVATAQAMKSQKQGSTRRVQRETDLTKEIKTNVCALCKEDHRLLVCQKFRKANVDARWNIVKRTRLCFRCIRFRHRRTECRGPPCLKCGSFSHHISLCRAPKKSEECFVATRDKAGSCIIKNTDDKQNDQGSRKKRELVNARDDDGKAYLKIVPVDLYGPKGQIRVLALLDEGSSVTLLDSSVAEKIGAKGKKEPLAITAIGGSKIKKENSQRIRLGIKGAHSEFKDEIEVRTIENLKVMEQGVDMRVLTDHSHLSDIRKELTYTAERPKLLIGQDNWGLIYTKKLKIGKTSNLVASLTKLGWVLHGCNKRSNSTVNFISHVEVEEDRPKEVFRRRLKSESWGLQARLPRDNRSPLEVLKKTTEKKPNDQYNKKLLQGKKEETLPNDQLRRMKKQSDRTPSSSQWKKTNPHNMKKFATEKVYPLEKPEFTKRGQKRNLRTESTAQSFTDNATKKMSNRFNRVAPGSRSSVGSPEKEHELPGKRFKKKIEITTGREPNRMVMIIDSMGNVTRLNPGPDSRIIILGYSDKIYG